MALTALTLIFCSSLVCPIAVIAVSRKRKIRSKKNLPGLVESNILSEYGMKQEFGMLTNLPCFQRVTSRLLRSYKQNFVNSVLP
jgi:hypothetical protein